MFCAASLPRKWSIRKICSSSKTSCSSPFSFFAEARSVPNGFSMMIRLRSTSSASREQVHDGEGRLRRDAEVVQPAQLVGAELGLGLGDGLAQRLGATGTGRPAQPLGELVPALGLGSLAAVLRDRLGG